MRVIGYGAHLRTLGCATCLFAIVVLSGAQSGSCPQLTHASQNGITDQGLLSTANVDVEVVDTSNGDFSSDQVDAIQTAIENMAAAPGSNADSTTTNTDTMPNLSDGTASNPIEVVEIATQAQIDTVGGGVCAGASACTSWNDDSNGHVMNSTTLILAGAVVEQVMEHEFGHADMGMIDCNGCSNTIMNPAISDDSPTAPTSCDDIAIKAEQKCNCN